MEDARIGAPPAGWEEGLNPAEGVKVEGWPGCEALRRKVRLISLGLGLT